MSVQSRAGKKPRTTHRTFRFRTDYMERLVEEAKAEGVTVNARMNAILKRYVEFERYMIRYDLPVVTRGMMMRLIEAIPEKKLESVGADVGSSLAREMLLVRHQSLSYENFFQLIRYFAAYSGHFKAEERTDSRRHTFYLTHNMGRPFSLFLKGFWKAAGKIVAEVTLEVETGDDVAIITIPPRL